jgi:Polysaccharide lyase
MDRDTVFRILLVAATGLIAIILQPVGSAETSSAAELIWTGDFETGDFSQYRDKLYGGDTYATKRLVKFPVRAGKYATELTILDVQRDGTHRAELVSRLQGGGDSIAFEWDGPEYWIGFSFLFKEWESNAYTFFQIHAPNEPKGDPCDYAGNAFSVWGSGSDSNRGVSDKIVVRVIEEGGLSRGKGAGSNNIVIHSYPFPINEWQDYVVNFRLSTRGEGFYKIWKDGKVIYSKSGLTNVNHRDSCGNEIPSDKRKHNGPHLGIYAPKTQGYRRIFFDEVRVAIGSDGYALVTPAR